ncbi:MAG: protein-L-isoaspartate O-methyltransferase, partial [Candidatus Marinimicrobia bacterium]|nr:protein-L-isoaspartate O-methyltransferase [Candidatus Neomarinimicrobiota bacterium]
MRRNAQDNKKMIETQVKSRGIKDKQVIQAMQAIDRADFVDTEYKD